MQSDRETRRFNLFFYHLSHVQILFQCFSCMATMKEHATEGEPCNNKDCEL